jgi:FKBP-type peptidyl-prolyl cis-trans isomerase
VSVVRVRRLAVACAAVGVVLASAAGCIKAPSSPTTTPAFTKTDLTVGTGAEAATGSVLTVNYTGWLYDPSKPDFKGAQFDSSIGASPFTFTLGDGSVIAGWDQGLVGMKVGGVRRLVVPPSYGYGAARVSAIPANATILFDIELLSIE